MADNWHVGNATDEADEHRGWLLGHFMAEPGDPSIRATNALEVKWESILWGKNARLGPQEMTG